MSEHVEGDRKVVTGQSAGSHFPRRQAEIHQRFEADGTGREGPFFIEGSVYGKSIRFRGAGTVLGPVLGRGDVTFADPGKGLQRLLGGVFANGNVVSEPTTRGARASLLASVTHAATLVRGDVVADQVALTDTVVFGNIHARRMKLARCIVFGQLVAKEAALVSASTVLAYDAHSVRFEGPCCLVFVAGTSVTPPTFGPYVDELGAELPCSLMFLPAMRAMGPTVLTFRPWEPSAAALERARLVPADWVKATVEVVSRQQRGGQLEQRVEQAERHVLSIGGRALNFGAIKPQLDHMTWLLRTALEFEHYDPRARTKVLQSLGERCSHEERYLVEQAISPAASPAAARGPAPSDDQRRTTAAAAPGGARPPSPATRAIPTASQPAGAATPQTSGTGTTPPSTPARPAPPRSPRQ